MEKKKRKRGNMRELRLKTERAKTMCELREEEELISEHKKRKR